MDWDQNVYFSCNGTHRSREKCGVPFSCCIPDPAVSGSRITMLGGDQLPLFWFRRLITFWSFLCLFQDRVINTQCGYDVRNRPKVSTFPFFSWLFLFFDCGCCSVTTGTTARTQHQSVHLSVRLTGISPLIHGNSCYASGIVDFSCLLVKCCFILAPSGTRRSVRLRSLL